MKWFEQYIKLRYVLPLSLVAIIGFLLIQGLRRDPTVLPSALINRPFPGLMLPEVFSQHPQYLPAVFQGNVALIHIWATWCPVCQAELPLLQELAKQPHIQLYSIVYKDSRHHILSWLQQVSNPYLSLWLDEAGAAGIELGVYGVPELYIVDKRGRIRYRHAGKLSMALIQQTLLPLVKQLNQECCA